MDERRGDGSGWVLVVDDDPAARDLIRVNLELDGFRVATARDGAECLEVVHRVRPHVVTLDAEMPRLGGAATAEALRADPRTRGIPLALITAGGDTRAPVDGWLAKPFDPAALVRLVRTLRSAARAPIPGDGVFSPTLAP
ncbi:hypothetical protein BIV57_14290 [Mangrovactinospora gilvigrisea]|uniref:Response regulatory domain-containing protein n=1 Tax=Mangrovactinospora gilvigrisea TaxID=1428644 RepID=A0A1J7BDW2_9ACTN|nr:hypothetical protein BIV57_14290 [Mangrovactinospora gilvigrisea]